MAQARQNKRMYLPKHFEATDHAMTLEVMREYSFATLIACAADGEPFATHLPVIVSDHEGAVTIHFHIARANPHGDSLAPHGGEALAQHAKALIAFVGPHGYQSPSIYSDLNNVPSWNYLAVHAYGEIDEIVESHRKDALLKSLIALHEPPYAQQWMGLDEKFQDSLLGAIRAFRMTVTRLESKFKLNQHRKHAHAAMKAQYAVGNANEQALGRWMERLGL